MGKIHPNTPVIIGAAQFGDHKSRLEDGLDPLSILEHVSRAAVLDAVGASHQRMLMQKLDMVAVVRSFSDSSPVFAIPWVHYSNLPKSLSNRLGATPSTFVYPHVGGNSPQYLINESSERIAKGETGLALLTGAEALRTVAQAKRAGVSPDWSDDPGGNFEEWGDAREGVSGYELAYGIGMPTTTYPLFENALAAHYQRTMSEHRSQCGALLHRFASVAKRNPLAAFPTDLSAEDIVTPHETNRMIGWPYTKAMCAQMYVNQGAAVLIASYQMACELGVDDDKMVYLHGCADTHEKYLVSERVNYYECPAMKTGAEHALFMAGIQASDIGHFDLYSCFSSAVEVACDALGISHEDPRGLTLTGGLPFFGGPGNNYTMHGIAEMVTRLRANPGDFGFVNGNGWFLTKHSFGIYSTSPPQEAFERISPSIYQAEVDAMQSPVLIEDATGPARLETFSVAFGKGDPSMAVLIGRLDHNDARFLSVSMNQGLMHDLMNDERPIGRPFDVFVQDQRNIAKFN